MMQLIFAEVGGCTDHAAGFIADWKWDDASLGTHGRHLLTDDIILYCFALYLVTTVPYNFRLLSQIIINNYFHLKLIYYYVFIFTGLKWILAFKPR